MRVCQNFIEQIKNKMSSNKNIKYSSDQIESFYKNNRAKWNDFYASERYIFENVNIKASSTILDIGCGCGGLGNALRQQYGISRYTGVDINEKAIQTGRMLYPDFTLIAGDILNGDDIGLGKTHFDIVAALSCIDFNVEFDRMLAASMERLNPGGVFISSFRLTDRPSLTSLDESFQFINFDGELRGEKAPYVVMNYHEMLGKIELFSPRKIQAYGYWGKPSKTAVMPYDEVFFSVFAVTKGPADICEYVLDVPESIKG